MHTHFLDSETPFMHQRLAVETRGLQWRVRKQAGVVLDFNILINSSNIHLNNCLSRLSRFVGV